MARYSAAVVQEPRSRIEEWRAELIHILPRIGATFGTSAAIAVFGVISGGVAARALGPASRGELAMLLLWPQLLCTLGNLGVDAAATYLGADPAKRRDLPATLFAIAAVQAVALMAAYAALAPLLFGSDPLHALAMLPLIPSYLLGAYALATLSGQLRFRAFNVVRIAMPALYTGLIVALAWAGALSALTAALAYLAAHAAADGIAIVLVRPEIGFGRVNVAIARQALSYGIRAHAGRLTPAGLGVDVVIVALVLTVHDVGLFAAATALMMAPRILAASMQLVVFPQVSATHQAGGRGRLPATFAMYVAACLGIAALLVLGAGPLTRVIFGPEFGGAAQVVRLLAVASALQAIRQFPLEVQRGRGRPGITAVAEGVNWICFLVVVPAGAVAGGLTGAATGSLIASGVALVATAALVSARGSEARA